MEFLYDCLYCVCVCLLFWFNALCRVELEILSTCGNSALYFEISNSSQLAAKKQQKKSSSLKNCGRFFIYLYFYFAALLLLKRLKQSSLKVKLFLFFFFLLFFRFNVFTWSMLCFLLLLLHLLQHKIIINFPERRFFVIMFFLMWNQEFENDYILLSRT